MREQPRGRVEVDLDGAPWRLVPTDAVVRSGLVVGRILDRETARTLGRELRRADALACAARALRPRDRSRRALEHRLTMAGVPARARGDALDLLERTGLVDDARVAATRAESLAERGFGDAAIRYDLEREGIAGDLIEEAVGGLRARAGAGSGADGTAGGGREDRPLARNQGVRPLNSRGRARRSCGRLLIR